jgi:undecaprenyl-diphosphatase
VTAPTRHRHLLGRHEGPLALGAVVLVDVIVVAVAGAVAVALGLLAAYDGGSVLLTWDEPIQRFVEAARTGWLDRLFLTVSRLGSNIVVFPVAIGLATLAWRRCRPLALFVVISAFLRPGMEFLLKELIDRPRPDMEQMVNGTGPSHPSGHVLASLAVWGLLPAVIAVVTGRRSWWRVSVVAVMLVIPLIAASRVYLGVHWTSDVFGGLLIGLIYLLSVEVIFLRSHPEGGCGGVRRPQRLLGGPVDSTAGGAGGGDCGPCP